MILMRQSAILVFFLTAVLTCRAQVQDSTGREFKAGASFSFNSDGINPIPAFSLGKPAVMASLNFTKGRFSYDPALAYGLDAKPWYIDNWFHYRIINRPEFKLRTGINFSMFFSEKTLTDENILQGQRYFTGELAGIFNLTPTSNITLMYWSDNGQEHGTLTGHFISLSAERSNIKLGRLFLMTTFLQLFSINYDGPNDGLFVSPKISFSANESHFSVFLQATQPITTNISPYPGFQWNVGLAYLF
jgi:hypothetical protein